MTVRPTGNQESAAQGQSRDKPRRVRPVRARAPRIRLLPQLMADAVEANPDAVALVMDERSVTYAELDDRSSRWARLLIDQGVGPEDVVALALVRSIDSVTAVWAVAKTGAAFVPVDPTYPHDRILHMLSDSGARWGITSTDVRAVLPDVVTWSELDDPATVEAVGELSGQPIEAEDRRGVVTAANCAYIIYTSGSTGIPKGVVVTHGGLENLSREQVSRFTIEPSSRTLHFASPSFDASLLELLLAIGAGSTMVIVPTDVYGGPELHDVLTSHRVTHAFITPAALASVDPTGLDSLAVIAVGGEAFSPDLLSRWAPGRSFFNGYGPTETTIMSNISDPLGTGDPIDIGTAIRGMTAYILDSRLRRVPPGVAGELYLAGPGLARGYHSRHALTANRFVANPFTADGTRLYRTGDLVRWRGAAGAERAVEFIGRNDFQVKIRGFRVELGEIDAVLAQYPGIDFVVTVPRTTPAGATTLAAYVKPAHGTVVDFDELHTFAGKSLPEHMIPAFFMTIDHIPLTPVGKLDRDALPPIAFESRAYRAPVTSVQSSVADVFADILGVDRAGLDDDFFELGGNSLMATAVAARLGAALDTQIPVRTVFTSSSVEALAAAIESAVGEGSRTPLAARERPEIIPLSLAQQRMWFLNQFDTTSPVNNIPLAVRFTGPLDTKALEWAVADVIARHESLRTMYPAHDGIGYQHITAVGAQSSLTTFTVSPTDLLERVERFLSAGFDVSSEIPLRVALFEVDVAPHQDPEYVLALVIHHISGDGSSMAPLARDVMAAYGARASGTSPSWAPLRVQYADFTLWQHEVLGSTEDPGSVISAQLLFWRDTLAGVPPQLELPTDRPRPSIASGRGAVAHVGIDADLRAALSTLAAAHGATEFMVMHAVLAVTLARLSSTSDVVIGTPTGGRGDAALDDVIGMFVNTLALRTRVEPGQPFDALLDGVRASDLDAFGHTEVPFERLVEIIDPPRSQGRHPLFQVALFFQNFAQQAFEIGGLAISAIDAGPVFAKFDLQFTVSELAETDSGNGGYDIEMLYATDLFDASTVTSMGEMLVRIARSIAGDARTAVGDIDVLTPEQRATVLHEWNASAHDVEPEGLLRRFEVQVAATPDATAMSFGTESLTYAEFGARVNRLARYLIAAGVGPEVLVGLAVRRSFDLLVAMYAIVTAGGGFVPIDPDQPAERTGYILDVANPAMVLTTSRDSYHAEGGAPTICVDTLDISSLSSDPVDSGERISPLAPHSVAYVIFTSGSTGKPKGVAVEHSAIVNQMAWMRTQYRFRPTDVYLQKTATTFDVSLWGFFLPLQVGAQLVIATPDGHRDPEYLSGVIAQHGVTLTDFVPSMLSVFAGHARSRDLRTLREVFVIGEALPRSTVDAFGAVSAAGIQNLYGPTEAAVSVTFASIGGGAQNAPVPIGVPEWNCTVMVLDARLHPVPIGSPGELYLAGAQTARGYVRRPDLTAASFVAHPYGGAGEIMYRTGDLVRWSKTGTVEYLGRTDFQVKFRGQRIELGEIEASLRSHVGVRSAVVTVATTATGDQLVGYVVPGSGTALDSADVLESAKRALPSYMVPAAVVVLASFPVNSSGKLDRKLLPTPVFESMAYTAPTSALEQVVAQVFSDVLGVARVGRSDDFFALGGNSLVATQVAARLSASLDRRVPVRSLFETSSVAALASRLETADIEDSTWGAPLNAGPRPEQIPLSMAQQRMWFLNQFDTASAVDNLPFAIRLRGTLDRDALTSAVSDLVARHESLRTLYPSADGVPFQKVVEAGDVALDMTATASTDATLIADLTEFFTTGFDVTREVPLRILLCRLNDDDHVLAVVVHHISGDAFSMGPLARDLVAAYGARVAGDAPAWAPLSVQYADYAVWQRAALGSKDDPDSALSQQIRYWTSTLAGIPDQIDLPADRPRPLVSSNIGGNFAFDVDAGTHAQLRQLAADSRSTVFMVVHAALSVLLARLTGTRDIVLGTPVAGRGAAALDDVIGMFVNTVVLRTEIDPAATFAEILASVRHTDLGAFEHADLPFDMLVEQLDPERSEARNPIFQVALSFQNAGTSSVELPGLSIEVVEVESRSAKFDLQVTLAEKFDADGAAFGLDATLTYATDLFDAGTIAAFSERFLAVLCAVAQDSSAAVGALNILTDSERAAVTAPATPATPPRILADLMSAAALRNPSGDALAFGNDAVTYQDLDERSSRMARELISRGARPGTMVAVALPRSIGSVVALWAVAKSGAAYVPVDPNYPADRVRHMLTDARVELGLTTSDLTHSLPQEAIWIPVDSPDFAASCAALSSAPIENLERSSAVHAADAAYVTYTSGSTGRPKGVVVTHAGLANFMAEQVSRYGLTETSRTLHFASPSFDASMLELLLALGASSTMVICPPFVYGGVELESLLREQRVTHAFITPAALATVEAAELPDFGVVVAGGEACTTELVTRWAPERRLYNGFGPTETTIMSNISDPLTVGARIDIGGPIRGVASYVLDDRLEPVPVGVTGELYISGIGLARGYHERPSLTSLRFMANPFDAAGVRMYRTGDLVRWIDVSDSGVPALTIEYVGRADFQVKIRGFRIELGEIDSVLTGHPDIGFAVTVGREMPTRGTALVSYVLPAATASVDSAALTKYLGGVLPSHMVPSAIVVLQSIPLTPVGKLDRSALPEPEFTATTFEPATTPMEIALAEVFAEVLGLDRVSVADSFFALGGDSIVSIQLVSRARSRGIVFSPRDVFERKSVAGLAEVAVVSSGDSAAAKLEELDGGGIGLMPPTPAVQFMIDRPGGFGRFTQSLALELPVGIDRAGLVDTLTAVVDHHDMLRAELVRGENDEWQLGVRPPGAVDVDAVISREEFDPQTVDAAALMALAAEAVERELDYLDPSTGMVVRGVWLDPVHAPTQAGRLILVVHHMVIDGVSWRILVPDLIAAWSQISQRRPAVLPAVGTSFRRWSHALADLASSTRTPELGFWRSVFGDVDPLIGSRAFDPVIDVAATVKTVSVHLSEPATDAVLTTVPARYHGAVNDVLLAALGLAVMKWRRGRGVESSSTLIRLEGHGREEEIVPGADLSRTVGWFTSIFPVRLDLGDIDLADAFGGGVAAGDAVKLVKEQLLAVPDKGIGYGILRYLDAESDLPDASAAQISFNYLGRVSVGDIPEGLREYGWIPAGDLGDVSGSDDTDMPAMAAVDINAVVVGGRLNADFGFASGLLATDEVQVLADLWMAALDSIVAQSQQAESGGHTPSDFGLVRVTQRDVDAWEERYTDIEDVWTLSPLQRGLLFHALVSGSNVDVYTPQVRLHLAGGIDSDRLRRAAQAVVTRYANLRTAFVPDGDGDYVQVVLTDVTIPWSERSMRDADADAVERALLDEQAHVFDLASPPLIRFLLLRTADDAGILAVTSHHILLDGWSMPLLMKDLLVLYAAHADRSILPAVRPYRSYLAWLSQRDSDAASAAWRSALEGADEPTLIRRSTSADQVVGSTGEYRLELDDDVSQELTRRASEIGVTMSTVVQSVWAILLARLLTRTDVVFGATVSGRPAELTGIESMVGLFINTIPVRVHVVPATTFRRLLTDVQSAGSALLDYHYVGLPDIVASAGVGALFDTLVVFESYPIDRAGLAEISSIDGMSVTGADTVDATHYPLTVVAVAAQTLTLTVKYQNQLFSADDIAGLADRLVRIFAALVDDPDVQLGDIDILSASERTQLLSDEKAAGAITSPSTLSTLFADRVSASPDSIAVSFGDDRLSYAALDARSNQLARILVGCGVGPDSLVAIAVPRSVDLVVAVLAVVKSGGGYLPVDLAYPAERTAFVIEDAQPICVITTTSGAAALPDVAGPVFVIEDLVLGDESPEPLDPAELTAPVSDLDTAYVIYTSGSTGTPKGVVIFHRSVVQLFANTQPSMGFGDTDVWTMFHSFAFDFSVWELWGPLLHGGRLVMVDFLTSRSPADFLELLRHERVTMLSQTPTAFSQLIEADRTASATEPLSLKYVIFGGEALDVRQLSGWTARHPARGADGDPFLVNMYGITETTVHVTKFDIGDAALDDLSSIVGRAIPGLAVRVLDSRLQPVPVGVVGEIYVAGGQLARGYLNRPGLTTSRFVADPFGNSGDRLYRSGDLARWTAGGELDYVGRADSQIQLRGFRIELGEVEAALLRFDAVAQAAVILFSDDHLGDRLIGYVVPQQGRVVDAAELRHFAAGFLTDYMMPDSLVVLDNLPLTINGKLDRRRLPIPALAVREYVAPASETEIVVARIYADVLGAPQVGATDDFFSLGGNSILATKVISQLRRAVGADVAVAWIFADGTVGGLANRIDSGADESSRTGLGVVLPLRPSGPASPLFCVHPLDGLAWCYSGLVGYIDSAVPVYGLQSPSIEEGWIAESLDELAVRYATEILDVQPQGPYRLLGWSLGGVLAHAVAVELQRRGHVVSSLIIIDAILDIPVAVFADEVRRSLRDIGIEISDSDLRGVSRERAAAIHRGLGASEAALSVDQVKNMFDCALRSPDLILAHVPGSFVGDVLYLSAGVDHPRPSDAADVWLPYVTGNVDVVMIEAAHGDMMSAAALEAIGPAVQTVLT